MSWSLNKVGRASKLGETIKETFAATQGCPAGSGEEAAKDALGDVAEVLCKSLISDPVVRIVAHGSAWNDVDGNARQTAAEFKFETIGDFVE